MGNARFFMIISSQLFLLIILECIICSYVMVVLLMGIEIGSFSSIFALHVFVDSLSIGFTISEEKHGDAFGDVIVLEHILAVVL